MSPDLEKLITDQQARGEARLFPSLKSSNKEATATSMLLAVFRMVPELFDELMQKELRLGKRGRISAFTEVTLKGHEKKPNDRPDGLIYIKNKKDWTALVEAKVGSSLLDEAQVRRYLDDANAYKMAAVITISREITQSIKHTPLNFSKNPPKKVSLYHFSWRLVETTVRLILSKDQVDGKIADEEKQFVLEEFSRFLRDESAGSNKFSMMPSRWKEYCEFIGNGGTPKLRDPRLIEAADGLAEEFSDIALMLTDHLGVECNAKLAKPVREDRSKWAASIAQSIVDNSCKAHCAFHIPNAANELEVEVDLHGRAISVGMETNAPAERSTNRGKISWLINQLKAGDRQSQFPDESMVVVRWKSRRENELVKLSALNADSFKGDSPIAFFKVKMTIRLQDKFKSRKRFIIELEKLVNNFYDKHGLHLRKWIPRPPKPIENQAECNIEDNNDEASICKIPSGHAGL